MAFENDSRTPNLVPTRTRLNVKQSKTGCYLCRAQRKKCGEEKPACLRCVRAKRICEGYNYGSLTASEPKASLPLPCHTISTRLPTDYAQSRFASLGVEVLAQEACMDSLGISNHVWTSLLPQLCATDLSVNAAVASLGATYEAIVLRPNDDVGSLNSLLTRQYNKALLSLQSDVLSQRHGPIPLFLTSIVLAAVEVLLRHLANALLHLRGAFTILTECVYKKKNVSLTPPFGRQGVEGTNSRVLGDNHALYLIGQALDIQTATYVLSRAPDLPISSSMINYRISDTPIETFTIDQFQSELLSLLHACYHHTSLASAYKYLPPCDIPSHIALDHGRFLARLSQWLSKVDYLTSRSTREGNTYSHLSPLTSQRFSLQILRIQCVSTIIYLSTVLSPEERTYDFFTNFFLQIVDAASTILDSRSSRDYVSSLPHRFRLLSPLSQPLFLTAMKCRQREIRRRAIDLLSLTGVEGPWSASIHVRVARRAVEIEERQMQGEDSPSAGSEDMVSETTTIPEKMRLHGCGIDSDTARHIGSAFIVAQFSRCVDVEHMVTRSDVPWNSQGNWNIWTERLSL